MKKTGHSNSFKTLVINSTGKTRSSKQILEHMIDELVLNEKEKEKVQ